MKASICIATHDKPTYLRKTLESIYRQPIARTAEIEVIVVDDRSIGYDNYIICSEFPSVNYIRLEGKSDYRNPAVARNVAYRAAKGEIIICESDDTIHITENCIELLISQLTPGKFVIANVFNADFNGNIVPGNLDNPEYSPLTVYTGPTNQRPFFFLGSLYRKDLYAVGGNDEEFTAPGREDDWFAQCLINGLGITPFYTTNIVGHHLQHKHLGSKQASRPSYLLYAEKYKRASNKEILWQSAQGPWQYDS